jgi:hypothetical protein
MAAPNIHFVKGFVTYGNKKLHQLSSSMISLIPPNTIKKSNLGFKQVNYIDINDYKLINEQKRISQFHSVQRFVDKYSSSEMHLRSNYSITPSKLLTINSFPDDTIIYVSKDKAMQKHDLSNLEYLITEYKWYNMNAETISMRNKLDYGHVFCTMNDILTSIKTTNDDLEINYYEDFMIFFNESRVLFFKNSIIVDKQVYCAIQNDKIIGVSDMSSKEGLINYFN